MTITLTRTPQGSVVTRTNECTNPSFEAGTTGWNYNWFGSGPGAGTNDRVTGAAWAKAGTAAIRKTWTTSPTANNDAGFSYTLPWTAGTVKTCSGWMLTPQSSQLLAASVQFLDALGANVGDRVYGNRLQTAINTWGRVSITAQAPVGAVNASVIFAHYFGDAPMAPGSQLLLDAVLIESTSQLGNYFDGTVLPGDASPEYVAWTGSSNASSSTYSVPDPRAQFSPVLVNGFDDQTTQGNVVHQLISGAVAVSLRSAGLRSGTLKFLFATRAAAYAARAGMTVPGVWAFLDTDTTPETTMRFVATGQTHVYQSDSRSTWLLDVPFQEIS